MVGACLAGDGLCCDLASRAGSHKKAKFLEFESYLNSIRLDLLSGGDHCDLSNPAAASALVLATLPALITSRAVSKNALIRVE